MNRRLNQLALVIACGAQALLFQNCSGARFTNDANATLQSMSCQTNLIDSTRTVKILLMVDASGSNVPGKDEPDGTDPQKKWRLGAIRSLVDRYRGKSNIHFGLATFQETSAKPQIKNSVGAGIFTNSQNEIESGISSFVANDDFQATPYKAALELAAKIIKKDVSASADKDAVYSVIMVSDGMPSDYKSTTEMLPDISSVTEIAAGRVNLNTIFYYNTEKQRVNIKTDYLKTIAKVGSGSFAVANANESINLEDVIKIPQETCQ